MRIGPHLNLAYLRALGIVLFGVLIFALGLEALAVIRAKYRDLAVQPRWKGLVYWAIAIGVAILFVVWLLQLNVPLARRR